MAILSILLVSCGLVLSPAGSQAAISQQPDQQQLTKHSAPNSEQPPALEWSKAITLFSLSFFWLSFVIQLFILPFYNKSENLYKDYRASGRINSTIAALEAGELIPALAKMFTLAANHQTDKRRRPETEMENLLQSVEFIPDLASAQDAMIKMDSIRQQYERLKKLASRLWKIALLHAFVTLCIPAIYVFFIPAYIRIWIIFWTSVVIWLLSLSFTLADFFRFEKQIQLFNSSLEIDDTEGT